MRRTKFGPNVVFILLLIQLLCACYKSQDRVTVIQNKGILNFGVNMIGYHRHPYGKLANIFNENFKINLGQKKKYGFSKKIKNLKNGQYVVASIQMKEIDGSGQFICTKSQTNLKYSIKRLGEVKNGNWQTVSVEQFINEDSTLLHFYAFANKGSVEFKNLRITVYDSIPKANMRKGEFKTLRLYIPKKSKANIDNFAKTAIQNGVISKSQKKYLPAKILLGTDSVAIDIRLKGDWTDHLSTGKVSFRIKVKDDNTFDGMRTFSIQHPKTRNYMHEWLMHKICKTEGVLATRYSFVGVEINGIYKGVYALEEHFDKQLIKYNKRLESPVLKFDESGGWALTILKKKNRGKLVLPVFESTVISAFKKGRTIKNQYLKGLFIEGSKLVNHYKNLYQHIGHIIDIERTAKYFALLELGNSEHSHQWHNQRFYFNSIIQKLEFVGFDMNPGFNPLNELYILKKIKLKSGPKEWQLVQPLLQDRRFKKYYLFYLRKFSSEYFLNSIFRALEQDIKYNENLLSYEIPNYKFERSFYSKRFAFIREEIDELDLLWEEELNLGKSLKDYSSKYVYENQDSIPYVEEISVNTYVNQIGPGSYELEFCNYLLKPAEMLGYEDFSKRVIFFEKPIKLEHFSTDALCKTITTKKKPKKIFFKVLGIDTIVRKKEVLQWPKPKGNSARIELENKFVKDSPYYSISDSVLTFSSGHLIIYDLIYIPDRYHVVIKEGTTIDFRKEGGIICTQSVFIHGTKSNNIRFTSGDSINNGLTILNAKNVHISNVEFDNMKPLNYKGWSLSGGINIYESQVKVDNCTIKNAKSEDALNLIRSSISINKLRICNAASNGLHTYYCSGGISNSEFTNIGNIGLNFSDSKISISNASIKNAGENGMLCVEESNISLNYSTIEYCKIGVVVKDASRVQVKACNLLRIDCGFAIFSKKSDFNEPKLHLEQLNQFNVKMAIYLDHLCLNFYNNIREGPFISGVAF